MASIARTSRLGFVFTPAAECEGEADEAEEEAEDVEAYAASAQSLSRHVTMLTCVGACVDASVGVCVDEMTEYSVVVLCDDMLKEAFMLVVDKTVMFATIVADVVVRVLLLVTLMPPECVVALLDNTDVREEMAPMWVVKAGDGIGVVRALMVVRFDGEGACTVKLEG